MEQINLYDLMKYVHSIRAGKLGKVFVKYAEPIDLEDYIKTNSGPNLSLKLTRDLYQIQQKEQPITMNALISTSLLYNPKQEISFKHAIKITKNLYDYIHHKQFKTYVSATPRHYDFQQAALNLGFIVKGKPLDRKLGDEAIINMAERNQLLKMLSLSYYGNQLGVYFAAESMVFHSISLINKKSKSDEIDIPKVAELCATISDIFQNEFLPQDEPFDVQKVQNLIQFGIRDGIFEEGPKIRKEINSVMQKVEFFESLLQPYIDSYLIVAFAINGLMETGIIIEQKKLVNEMHIVI